MSNTEALTNIKLTDPKNTHIINPLNQANIYKLH